MEVLLRLLCSGPVLGFGPYGVESCWCFDKVGTAVARGPCTLSASHLVASQPPSFELTPAHLKKYFQLSTILALRQEHSEFNANISSRVLLSPTMFLQPLLSRPNDCWHQHEPCQGRL